MPLVHLAEELIHPARNVPIAMVGSVLVNGIMGFGYAIVLLISLGDLNELLTSPIGFPFMQLFLNVTKSTTGATILSLSVSLIAVAANAAGLTSTSRTAWAFARDSAIPSSRYFARVNSKLRVQSAWWYALPFLKDSSVSSISGTRRRSTLSCPWLSWECTNRTSYQSYTCCSTAASRVECLGHSDWVGSVVS
jgi:hypothetical protein